MPRFVLVLAGVLLAWIPARAADPADVAAARARVAGLPRATCTVDPAGDVTEIVIPDGAGVTADDLALFGRLTGLTKLHVLNCRALDDAMVATLTGLGGLTSLALTNSGIGDAGVAALTAACPGLVELDLSSNTNLTGASMQSIAALPKLERLSLVQMRFNDLHFRRLAKVPSLRFVDLRGTMEAGDPTLRVLGGLPHLRAFKHRSTVVTDAGLEALAKATALDSLLIQDFGISDAGGRHLAAMPELVSLEIFRCQGFGSDGVLELRSLAKLNRLMLRDLPEVGDRSLAVLAELPALKRLILHELPSVGDAGLAHLAQAGGLEVLDLWNLPKVTDASAAVIAGLSHVKDLSIRETGMTEQALDALAAMPALESLTFKNAPLSPAAVERLKAAKPWKKIDLSR